MAQSEEEDVLNIWQGLGYYRRARHLRRAAQLMVTTMEGVLPERLEDWLRLPGVGPSTAAAILAIGRDQPHAILDGNVKRVLSRLVAMPHPTSSTTGQRQLWSLAQRLTPVHRPGDYAQAIMDLGATLCTRTAPACQRCPWQAHCQAYALGRSTEFPVALPRPVKPRRVQYSALIFDRQERILLCQRPSEGLLAGLWEPPSAEIPKEEALPPDASKISQILLRRFDLETSWPSPLQQVQHTFTHFHLTVYPFVCQLEGGILRLDGYQACRWVFLEASSELPLATLHRKILAKVVRPTSWE